MLYLESTSCFRIIPNARSSQPTCLLRRKYVNSQPQDPTPPSPDRCVYVIPGGAQRNGSVLRVKEGFYDVVLVTNITGCLVLGVAIIYYNFVYEGLMDYKRGM